MGAWLGLGWTLVLLFLLLLLLWNKNRHKNLPPGPFNWPVLGGLPYLMERSLLQSFLKLREQYGDIFSVYLGSQPVIVLCGYKMVKAALVDRAEEFESRPHVPILEKTIKGYGIAFSNGETWKQLRRFTLITLRNFGMGKRSIEARIQEELGFLMEEFRKMQGSPFDPNFALCRTASNVICSVVFGERFQYDDKDFQTLFHVLHKCLRQLETTGVQLCNVFPGVMNFLPGPHNRAIENYEEQKRFVSRMVQKHMDTLDPAFPRDYIDTFLIQMQQGSFVFPMLHSVLYDPTQFRAPEVFEPGHFLDESGAFKRPEAFLPFSAGRRACPGESLVRMELFLYLTTILKNFALTSR